MQTLPIRDASDGDHSHRPKDPAWTAMQTPAIYLEKLGQWWFRDRGDRTLPGVTYTLDRLPDAYVLFERPRPNNPKIIDRHLYGSPKHKFYDSPARFYPHFLNLMRNGTNHNCPCTVCGSTTSHALPMSMPSAPKVGRLPKAPIPFKQVAPTYVDREGVSDRLRELLVRFQRLGRLDEEFQEPQSLDWHAERKKLPKVLKSFTDQASYLPRPGEVVLFVRSLEHHQEICREDESLQYKIYDLSSQKLLGSPLWEAGVIAQVPAENVAMNDLLEQGRKEMNITYSGFRVEPLARDRAGPGFVYVPLHHLRPFVFWEEYLSGISPGERHSSIAVAVSNMASFNLVEKYKIKGTWPKAVLCSKGIFLGSELIVAGDAVRLKDIIPNAQHSITDVLEVTHITTEFLFDEVAAGQTSLSRCKTSIAIYGHQFTTDKLRAYEKPSAPISSVELAGHAKGMSGYEWYRVLPRKKHGKVDLHRILGRNFEADAMMLWFPAGDTEGEAYPQSLLGRGLHGTKRARKMARKKNSRLNGKDFFWANSRGEGLDLKELNNAPLAEFDEERFESLEDRSIAARAVWRASTALAAPSNPPVKHGMHCPLPLGDTRTSSQDPLQQKSTPSKSFLLAVPQMRDVEAGDEENEGDMRARFGLGQTRKRSASVARSSDEEGVNGSHREEWSERMHSHGSRELKADDAMTLDD